VFAQQGALSLTDTLRNTPGITFQLGENGKTQSGDTLFMRGFDAQNAILVDGIRDLGAAVRHVITILA
jgi:catecholate siderophore receptor